MISQSQPNAWSDLKRLEAPTKAISLFAHDSVIRCVPSGVCAEGINEVSSFLSKPYHEFVQAKIDEKVISVTETPYRVVEESVVTLVHDRELEWLLPGVKRTSRRLVVPMVSIVTFDVEFRIKSIHFYWDQASLFKQIGVLPNSLYCKANSSECLLPVLGVRIADSLLQSHAAEESYASSEMHMNMPAEIVENPRHHHSVDHDNMLSHVEQYDHEYARQPVKSEMASILSGDSSVQNVRSSTRVHQQPGGTSSNIFGPGPVATKTMVQMDPKRYQSSGIFDEPIPTHAPHLTRRDPNMSSLQLEESEHRGKKTWSGKNTESQLSLSSEPTPVTSGRKFSNFTSQESLPTNDYHYGRKHFSGMDGSQTTFSFGDDSSSVTSEYKKPTPQVQRRDPNARSEEQVQRPSSRVLRAPGGNSTFSF